METTVKPLDIHAQRKPWKRRNEGQGALLSPELCESILNSIARADIRSMRTANPALPAQTHIKHGDLPFNDVALPHRT